MLDQPPYRACPSCRSDAITPQPAYSPDPWELAACAQCAFVYLRNPPEYKALEQEFAWEKTSAAKRESSRGSTFFSPMARKIRNGLNMYRDKTKAFRRLFNDGHVLDIGCGGTPRIPPPMTPYGIEISTQLHKNADATMRARGGYCLHGAGAEAIWGFEPEMFDGIVMNSYLEHEVKALDVLKGAHRALKSSGVVFVRVPNFGSLNRRVIGPNWCGFRYPDHVNYFTLNSLRDIAARAGFTTQLVNRFTLPVDDNITLLLRKSPEPQPRIN